MRVLKIIHTMGHGGAENVFRWLAWKLREIGVDVIAGIPSRNEPGKSENWIRPALEELSVPFKTFDKLGSSSNLLKNMIKLIKETDPDIVHSHLIDSNFYSSLAARYLSIPHVCTEHGDVALNGSVLFRGKFLTTCLLSRKIVCVSGAIRERALALGSLGGKLAIIHNGLAADDRGAVDIRSEYGIPAGALVIGNVGNLYPVKGQRYLVEAFARFRTDYPDSFLVIVGRGDQKDPLMAIRNRLGIPEERLILTGFRSDARSLVRSFDVYVQSSLSEGLPLALLEAMIAGLPIVATDVGGVREIIDDERYGFLVRPGSWEEILEGLLMISREIDRYRTEARSTAAIIKDRFSLDGMARAYLDLYGRILAKSVGEG